MEIRTAQEILQEIEETRQQIGTATMILDGAQVHFMLESFSQSLQVVAELFIVAKNTDPDQWDSKYGSQVDSLKTARELAFTGISTIKIFFESLPINLQNLHETITLEKLNLIEDYFKNN